MLTHSDLMPRLATSVFAVPPLARRADGAICAQQNRRLIAYLEAGGVRSLLYGGNANFYHLTAREFASTIDELPSWAGDDTWIVPAIGPAYGTMLDQAERLRDTTYPTAMALPQREIADSAGIATGLRRVAERMGKPLVVYLKHDGWLEPAAVGQLYRDGLISWIKYAVVRDDPSRDDYLSELLQHVPGQIVVSGIGEQPAIIHVRDFGLIGYTSGCVCVAPRLSMQLLAALRRGDFAEAERVRSLFEELENHRNSLHPIRVLHRAVELADIAATGPLLPMLSDIEANDAACVREAAMRLRDVEASLAR